MGGTSGGLCQAQSPNGRGGLSTICIVKAMSFPKQIDAFTLPSLTLLTTLASRPCTFSTLPWFVFVFLGRTPFFAFSLVQNFVIDFVIFLLIIQIALAN